MIYFNQLIICSFLFVVDPVKQNVSYIEEIFLLSKFTPKHARIGAISKVDVKTPGRIWYLFRVTIKIILTQIVTFLVF